MNARLPTPVRTALLAVLVALTIAACGGPTPPPEATGNAFVADALAGTILLASEPGTLTVADNTYLADTVTLVGE